MPDLVLAVPGSLDTPTGGYVYDRRMLAELRALGLDVAVVDLGEGFPRPRAAVRDRAGELLAGLAPGVPVIVDGLALGVLPAAARACAARGPLIALVHHPLALETGIADEERAVLVASETAALSFATAVVVTSGPTSATLQAEFAVPAPKITVVEPGTDPARFAEGSGDVVVSLLAVGAVTPRKGYETLVAALAMLDDIPWRLTIVGALDRAPDTVAAVRRRIAAEELGRRIVLAGPVEADVLDALYDMADVFVLASEYEGYGMAYAEAIARGLPVVGTTGGAIPATVPADAGLLVAPGDAGALAHALQAVLTEPDLRARMAVAARAGADRLARWGEGAGKIAALVRSLA